MPADALSLVLADAHALPRVLAHMLTVTVELTHPLCDCAAVSVYADADADAVVNAVGEMSVECEASLDALCVPDELLLSDGDGEVVALAPDALSLGAALVDAADEAEPDEVKAADAEAVPVREALGVLVTDPVAKALLLAENDKAEDSDAVSVCNGDAVPKVEAVGCALSDAVAHAAALGLELAVKWLALGVPLEIGDNVFITDIEAVPVRRETVCCAVDVTLRVALDDTDELTDGDADALPLTRALADPLGDTDGEPDSRVERDELDVIDEDRVKTLKRVALAREDAVAISIVREGEMRGDRDTLTLPLSVIVADNEARDAVGKADFVALAVTVAVAVIENVGNDGNADRDGLTVVTTVRERVEVAQALAKPLAEPDTEAIEIVARALTVFAKLRDAVAHGEVECDGELVAQLEMEGEAEIDAEADPDGVTEPLRDTRALKLKDGVALCVTRADGLVE